MAISVVQICNRALRAIGQETITALTDTSTDASLCSLHYAPVRDAVLRAHPWKFALERASLAVSGTPAFEYDHSYNLPADCLRILKVYSASAEEITTEEYWRKEGRAIVTSEDAPLYLWYVKRVTDPTLHDPLFDEALVARLAATIADDRSKPQHVIEREWGKYQRMIAEAQFVDSTESSLPEQNVTDWEAARA